MALGLTVFFPNRRFVDDIVVVDVQVQLEYLQLKADAIDHRGETVVITRRTSRPIFAKVCEHVDMFSDEVHNGFTEADVEVPPPLTVPLERGRYCTSNLKRRNVGNHVMLAQIVRTLHDSADKS